SDSQVVTLQVNGSYQVKDPTMKKYLDQIQAQLRYFSEIQIQYIFREQNVRADVLSKFVSIKSGGNNRSLLQEILQSFSVL
ncbi:hypothetical protein C1T28_21535, partial [Bacillus subtilis]